MKTLTVFLLLSALSAFAQPNPDTLWTRIYGGTGWDDATSIQQTTDGGYVIAGYTDSFGAGHSDCYVVKIDAYGDTLWTHSYGGNINDAIYSIQQTTDDGYIFAGSTNSFGIGDKDFYVVKTDSQGSILWTRTYGGNGDDGASFIQETAEGGYVIVGYTASFGSGISNFYIIKIFEQGDTLWTRTYGGSGYNGASAIQQTTDGGYVIAGWTRSVDQTNDDFYIVKIDGRGDTLWTRTYGGTFDEQAYSVLQTSDNDYIIAGYTNSFGVGFSDIYLLKINGQGDTLWTRTYGGSGSEYAFSIQQTIDEGYIIAGTTNSWDSETYHFYVVKINALGDTLWTRTYRGNNSSDQANSIQQTIDGAYIVAGNSYSFGAGGADFYIIKTGPDQTLSASEPSSLIPRTSSLSFAYPNPFNPTTTIEYTLSKSEKVSLKIFNLLGQEIETLVKENQSAGIHHIEFDGANLPSGVYLYRIETASFSDTKKMLLLK